MSVAASAHPGAKELHGIGLWALVIVLSMANFLAFLDTTIANVLVGTIAGSLATSPSNGTWVITGYAVAEAIMVPLTSWLIGRFGAVRTFVTCIVGFGIFSLLCGMATSLPMLIFFRVCLGICGGPMIPISQTLLLKITPSRSIGTALTIWSIGSVLAPAIGPVIGGLIGDNVYWGWAFYFKVPLSFAIAFLAWMMLKDHETDPVKDKVDFVGLGLLVVWVGALQIMLGNGQDMDWFNSDFIVVLFIIAVLGFLCFAIWEYTDGKPIVDLRIFQNRTFAVSMVVVGLAFGCMFSSIVLVPMWQQGAMGYTSTWAGYNAAMAGITMIVAAPVTGWLTARLDIRAVVFLGLLLSATSDLMRVVYNDQITFWQLMWPQLIFGFGMVMTMVPLVEMSTANLPDKDIANGSGQFNFIRTLATAIATAVVVAQWNDNIKSSKDQLVNAMHDTSWIMQTAQDFGIDKEPVRFALDQITMGQSVMQATNNTFLTLGILTLVAGALVWAAPKPPKRDPNKIVVGH